VTDGEAGVSTDVDGAQLGWNTALGYRLGRHFAAEVGYLDAHVTEAYEAPPSFPRPAPDFIIDHTVAVTGPTLSVLGAVRPVPPFDVFLRVGVLFADREIRVHPGSPDTTLGDEVWLAGLGADWLIAPR
jgi:hypothetical protein